MLRAGSIFGILVLATIANVVVSNRCLTMLEEVNPKRVVQMDGQPLNITFEVSDRVTQRLSTIIMKIFLTEVLGYTGVSVFEVEDEFKAGDTFRRLTDGVSPTGQRM